MAHFLGGLANKFLSLIGYRIVNSNRGIYLEKNMFFDEFRIYKSYFKTTQDLIIFDVGAYTGQSAKAYRRVFRKANIYCFEPAEDNYSILYKKFNDNPAIILNQLALGASNSTEELFILGNRSSGNSIIPPRDTDLIIEKKELSVIKLDDYCDRIGLSKIDILKIDTQGYEKECLQGAKGFLASSSIGLIKLEIMFHNTYNRDTSFFAIEEILGPYGYKLIDICWIKKSSKKNCTLVVDVIYGNDRYFSMNN